MMAEQHYILDSPVQIHDLHTMLGYPFTFYRNDVVDWPKMIPKQDFQFATILGRKILEIRFKNLLDFRQNGISHSFSGSLFPPVIQTQGQSTSKKQKSHPMSDDISFSGEVEVAITAIKFSIPLEYISGISNRDIYYALCEHITGKFLLLCFNKDDILRHTKLDIGDKTNSGGTRIPS